MLKLYAMWLVTMSYFSITHPSAKCWFNSVNSNSMFLFSPLATFDVTFATNTFLILFIIKVKILFFCVSSVELMPNVLRLCDVADKTHLKL